MKEIEENEIRVIGSDSPQSKRWLLPLLCAVGIGIIVLVVLLVKPDSVPKQVSTEEPTILEPQDEICAPKIQQNSANTMVQSHLSKILTPL